jgi:hypothetical protein
MFITRLGSMGSVGVYSQQNVIPTGNQINYWVLPVTGFTYSILRPTVLGKQNNLFYGSVLFRGVNIPGANQVQYSDFQTATVTYDPNSNKFVARQFKVGTSGGSAGYLQFDGTFYFGIVSVANTLYVMKMNNNFNVITSIQIGFTSSVNTVNDMVLQNGNLYLALDTGGSPNSFSLLKISTADLSTVWARSYIPDLTNLELDVDANENCYLSGRDSTGQMSILKIDSNGTIVASKQLTTTTSVNNVKCSFGSNNNFYIIFDIREPNSIDRFSTGVIKLDTNLNLISKKQFSFPTGYAESISTFGSDYDFVGDDLVISSGFNNFNSVSATQVVSYTNSVLTLSFAARTLAPFTPGERIRITSFNSTLNDKSYTVLGCTNTQVSFLVTGFFGTLSNTTITGQPNFGAVVKINTSDMTIDWANVIDPVSTYGTGGNPDGIIPTIIVDQDKILVWTNDGFSSPRYTSNVSPFGYANSGALVLKMPIDGTQPNGPNYNIVGYNFRYQPFPINLVDLNAGYVNTTFSPVTRNFNVFPGPTITTTILSGLNNYTRYI